MSLVVGNLAQAMIAFSEQQNSVVQNDPIAAQTEFFNKLEEEIYNIIRSATVVIPPSAIKVVGGSGPSTNPAPIVIQNSII